MLEALLARFGYYKPEYPRVHNGSNAIVRGQRWEGFYGEEGGLRDMIVKLRQAYFAKVGELKAGQLEELQLLATADRLARELDAAVRDVIASGTIEQKRLDQIARQVATVRRR